MADYGIQVISSVNGTKLFDSSEPYLGVSTVASGTVSNVGVYNPSLYAPGVIYDEGSLVFFKPSFINSGSLFLVVGKTIEYGSTRYKVYFKIESVYGTAPSTIDYIVVRPMTDTSVSGTHGLLVNNVVGSYVRKVFDSRAFTSGDSVQIDNVWDYRFNHTTAFGNATNNDEWYNTSSLQMLSTTNVESKVGLVYSRSTGSWNDGGPFPNTFSGQGIFHYGQVYAETQFSENYARFQSDYYIRAKKIIGT